MKNMSPLMAAWIKSPEADRLLAGGDRVTVGGTGFEVLETPGHSPGGISLYCPEGPDGTPVVFTGDALFAGSIGRTDLPGMSEETLLAAIRERLLPLPDETIVYPGHGPASTVGREKATNPWL
jgi:glyoxylase-like metal-dependent hydrolase (beta-lactamase superfamily II)